jgi:hypothetical protein
MSKKLVISHIVTLILGFLGGLLGLDLSAAQKPAEAVVTAVVDAPPVAKVDAGVPTIVNEPLPPPLGQ